MMSLKWKSSLRIFFSILITFITIAIITGLLVWIGRFDDLTTNFTFAHTLYLIVGVLNTAIIFWIYAKIDKKNPRMLGFRLTKKDVSFSCFASVISLLTVLSFILVLDRIGIVVASYQFDHVLTLDFFQLLAIASIGWFFAALKEEVLTRGYFLANLSWLTLPNAIVVSSLIFMALHFMMGDLNPFKAGSWFLGGITYAYIYVKSGSLTVSTIVHAAHNLVNDLVIHGNEGALVFLNSKVGADDKLIYEVVLNVLLVLLTYSFYGKNGVLTPANHLQKLWSQGGKEIENH